MCPHPSVLKLFQCFVVTIYFVFCIFLVYEEKDSRHSFLSKGAVSKKKTTQNDRQGKTELTDSGSQVEEETSGSEVLPSGPSGIKTLETSIGYRGG